jgi:hypothetical protein
MARFASSLGTRQLDATWTRSTVFAVAMTSRLIRPTRRPSDETAASYMMTKTMPPTTTEVESAFWSSHCGQQPPEYEHDELLERGLRANVHTCSIHENSHSHFLAAAAPTSLMMSRAVVPVMLVMLMVHAVMLDSLLFVVGELAIR